MGKIKSVKTNLKRAIQAMPEDIRLRLNQEKVLEDYSARPDYQQNDYLAWISRAKQASTRQKRTNQMLDELRQGGTYMKMDHPASRK